VSEIWIGEGCFWARGQRMMRLEGRMVLGSEGDGCCIASLRSESGLGSELSWV
jgi:hypothetical protein